MRNVLSSVVRSLPGERFGTWRSMTTKASWGAGARTAAIVVRSGLTSTRDAAGVLVGACVWSSPGQHAITRGPWQQACWSGGHARGIVGAKAPAAAAVTRLMTSAKADSLERTLGTVRSRGARHVPDGIDRFSAVFGVPTGHLPKFPQPAAGFYLPGCRA